MGTLTASLLAGALVFAADATIAGDTVRLGQVADLTPLPAALRGSAAELPLARFRRDADTATVPARYLSEQARARMPVLAPWLAEAQTGVVRLHRSVELGQPRIEARDIAKGDRVTLRIVAGIFTIERQGVALADARVGERLFVRTADGRVILAHCHEAGR